MSWFAFFRNVRNELINYVYSIFHHYFDKCQYIFINNFYTLRLYYSLIKNIFYKSDRTPNPGPGGGVVNDVSSSAGSAANLVGFCGPGGGLSPFLKAFIIAVALSGVKSS